MLTSSGAVRLPTVDFNGRVALVTGASKGIGRGFALELARAGTTVVGVARGPEDLAALDTDLTGLDERSWTRPVDVADDAAVRSLIDDIIERNGRLDILVNNAAVEGRRSVLEMDIDYARRIMDVNYLGTVRCTLAAIPHMVERGEGWIVGVTSGAARAPVPLESAYAASKAAIIAFCDAISYELQPRGVRVKILSPGFVGETPMAQGSVARGLPVPPKYVHRTVSGVARALVRKLDEPGLEINLVKLELAAVVTRALMPRIYRRSMRKMNPI